MTLQTVHMQPLPGIGEVEPGCDLAELVVAALGRAGLRLEEYDVLVIAQKAVSKAEGRLVTLTDLHPSPRARELAALTGKDERLVEAILAESTAVLRVRPGVIITRHRLGLVMAQAGVDQSNVPGRALALLLPEDPDRSAARLRAALGQTTGTAPGVIVSDSFGRPWRLGTTNVAIGAAGVPALWDRRGEPDRERRPLQTTLVAWADAVAAAAGLLMGEAAEGAPVIHVRGLRWSAPEVPARGLLRPPEEDLFT
jgi:coenzyme F420-0:L-glutamate ligase/coenzyme F420-1:gamma-L-glutamate ligase